MTVSGLSNFLRKRDERPAGAGDAPVQTPGGPVVRAVRSDEIDAALALLVADKGDRAAVEAFVRSTKQGGADLGAMMVLATDRTIAWAVLPLPLAGRATLLLVPDRLPAGGMSANVGRLVEAAVDGCRARGSTLVQALIDPAHKAVLATLTAGGFETIAELVYLSRHVRGPIRARAIEERYRLSSYDASTHERFARCIARTYVDSLDCPKLNGRRDIEDVIAGHKAAGEFDPSLWTLLGDAQGNDLGVLILSRLPDRAGLELVYVGLVPAARGAGAGDDLLRRAIASVAAEFGGEGRLLTACDAANEPARRLYHRHGFAQLYTRKALVRDL